MGRLIASLLLISTFCLAQDPEFLDFSVLPAEVADQLPNAFDPRGDSLAPCLEKENLSLAESLRIHSIEFSEGVDGFVIQGMHRCLSSGTGNAALLGFYPKEGRWNQVLSATGQRFNTRDATTNGLRDLEVWQHDSASRSIRLIYRFDGSKYDLQACDSITFSDLAGARLLDPTHERCSWTNLPQDPVRAPGPTKRLPKEIDARLLLDLKQDTPEVRQCLQRYANNLNTQVRIVELETDRGGMATLLQIVADGPCLKGNTSNGQQILIYLLDSGTWNLVLDFRGYSVTVLEAQSSGVPDLRTSRPEGRGSFEERFEFDGTKYQRTLCIEVWRQYVAGAKDWQQWSENCSEQ